MTERMDLLATRTYQKGGETRTAFTRIGTAWANTKGWSLTFEALPLPQINDKGVVETRVLMMPPREQQQASSPPQPAGEAGDTDDVPW